MNQARLNWCMILHIHQDETDLLDIQSVANEFVAVMPAVTVFV